MTRSADSYCSLGDEGSSAQGPIPTEQAVNPADTQPGFVTLWFDRAPFSRSLVDNLNDYITGGSTRCLDALEAHGAQVFVRTGALPDKLGGDFAKQNETPIQPSLNHEELWPVGSWLSAALDDPNVCEEMKRDIREWFDQGGHFRQDAALARKDAALLDAADEARAALHDRPDHDDAARRYFAGALKAIEMKARQALETKDDGAAS